MQNWTQISEYVDLIRAAGRTLSGQTFVDGAVLEACTQVECAGIPNSYRLPATAREYCVSRNSEETVTVLARDMGDPRVSPIPPLWPVLALLLLGRRHAVSAKRVMELASASGVEREVIRGLAVAAYLFPELNEWVGAFSAKMPPWERTFAVPLAARKLVLANTIPPNRWRVTGKSWRGVAHLESGQENQDAIQYFGDTDRLVVLAVADGHGSGMCFRSAVGSRLAVETAVRCLREFAETLHGDEQASAIADRARTRFVSELTESWRNAVRGDLEMNPFTPADMAHVAELEGWAGQQALRRHPESAYGTTMLAVLATERHVVCLQLGDGDILLVDSQGNPHRPISNGYLSRREQTRSLSQRSAAAHVRIHVENAADLPALILVTTDGYTNSYESDDELLEAGPQLLRIIRDQGLERFEQSIRDLLDRSGMGPSRDDITVGLICRSEDEVLRQVDATQPSVAGVAPGKWTGALRHVLGFTTGTR